MEPMVVKVTDIPAIILERIEVAHPTPALFSAIEIDDWPVGTLDQLRECGILQPAQRADALMCPGCGWQCHKPVVVRTMGRSKHAFILCDEEPDHGRQPVSLASLEQYSTTVERFSKCIARWVRRGSVRSSPSGNWFLLGTIKGRYGPREVSVGLDNGRLKFRVGQQLENALSIVDWAGGRLSVDMACVRRLANRKAPARQSRATRPPDHSRQLARARRTRRRNEAIFREAKKLREASGDGWTAIAKGIAATELAKTDRGSRLSPATVRRLITESGQRERENSPSDRKMRE
jgi:hypothetical protein